MHLVRLKSRLCPERHSNYYSADIRATLQSAIQYSPRSEGKCEVWTPALEPQPSRILHIPAHAGAGAGAGAGNRSEQACWAQRIVVCPPFFRFLLWKKTVFSVFLLFLRTTSGTDFSVALPSKKKTHTTNFFLFFLPIPPHSPRVTVTR